MGQSLSRQQLQSHANLETPGVPRLQALFQNKDYFERHTFFVFANMLRCCIQVCMHTGIMSPPKFLTFLVNKTHLLADRHFNCSSDESRSKHPDCVFLWGTSRGKEDANLKTVPLVRTILPSKHKFAKNFHDITKLQNRAEESNSYTF